MTRHRIFMSLLLVALLAGGPVLAGSMADSVARQLRAQGYSDIAISTTLRGRKRITASGRGTRREIVINPRTGEILRDYTRGKRTVGAILNPFSGLSATTSDSGSDAGADSDGTDGGNDGGGDSGGDGGDDGGE